MNEMEIQADGNKQQLADEERTNSLTDLPVENDEQVKGGGEFKFKEFTITKKMD
ncbi:MAG: hypothetical protein HOP19_25650 [Acidobacteria bacterium]|nr:hypothetical protein [Acidobacteriota bacterium]